MGIKRVASPHGQTPESKLQTHSIEEYDRYEINQQSNRQSQHRPKNHSTKKDPSQI